ncbi:MAG: hypothetical protein IAB75_03435 [Bacteroidetes bacterium]|uniref:Uncharacterized protein n=1 Tax=Candidatus Cryptobacteroides avicola TaxID=2840757 RepID=A0A940DRC6_9BACT|nr:hypothetical protein [Candidatus Cryptobacteroides avicola]
MCHTYQPFNQVCYNGHLAQIHSTNNDINISYVENNCTKNIYVKENELKNIALTSDLLDKLIGNRKFGVGDFVIQFNGGDDTVKVELDTTGSWLVSVNEKNQKQVKYLHELQNYIRKNTNGHILFLVDNSNILAI